MHMRRYVNLLEGAILPSLGALAAPIMATSLIQMAYNLVDMIWIGRISADAVAAVGAAGMFMWFSNGLATLSKMGGQIKVGQSLGHDDRQGAASYAHGAIVSGIVLALVFSLVCVLFAHPLIGFFNLNSSQVAADARNYLIITCGLVIFSFLNQIYTGIFTAMGNSRTSFAATAIGLVLNLILDPMFIFGFGPIPALGVSGAAIATVLAQAVVTLIFLQAAKADELLFPQIRLFSFPDRNAVADILRLGLPSALQSMLFSCISMVIARMIAVWGDGAVAVQKVGSQIESISWMSAEGFAAALNTFTAQNYGAGNARRIETGLSLSVRIMLGWGLFTTAVLLFFPGPIFRIFITDPSIQAMGIDYLRILALSQAFMCLEYTAAGTFNGLGRTLPPSIVSVTLTAARIPIAAVLTSWLGLNGVWWAITISSFAKGILLFGWLYKKKREPGFLTRETSPALDA